MSPQNSAAPLVVGLHIPKCAGLTLLRHVQQNMRSDLYYQCTGLYDNFTQNIPEFVNIYNKDRLHFVFGHHLHEEMVKQIRHPSLFFTGLREPIDRMNSDLSYNDQLSTYLGKTFDVAGYIRRVRNPTCDFIIHRFPKVAGDRGSLAERAMRVLECFHFVYFLDTFPELCSIVTQRLNLTPVNKNENVTQTPKFYDVDPKNFSEDIALYKEAFERWGPHSSVRGSPQADENIAALSQLPADINALRYFFYRMTYDEYRHWNVLDQVISARESAISELNAELEYYRAFTEQKKLPTGPG